MRFEAFSRRAAEQRSDCLVIGVFERGELGPEALAVDRALRRRLRALLARGDFSGRTGETQLISELSGLRSTRLLLVGLGKKAQFNRRLWRRSLTSAIQALARTRVVSAALALERPPSRELNDYYFGRATAELTGAALYRINDLKSARRPRPPALARILVGPIDSAALGAVREGLVAGAALAESAQLLRNLGNLPANVCTPRYLAAQARELERTYRRRLRVRVFDLAGIRRLKMGCLLAVTRGSEEPPRFIVLE
jgi:leucyl aminopeptidase